MAGKFELCSICDGKLDGKKQQVTVRKVGLQSLIRASKEREEEKHSKWLDLDMLVVHKQCQLSFICKRQIAAAKKRKLKQSLSSEKPSHDDEPESAENTSDSKACLICGKIGDEEFEEKVKKTEFKKLITISKQLGDDKHLGWVDVQEIVLHKKCYATYLSKKEPAVKKRKLV